MPSVTALRRWLYAASFLRIWSGALFKTSYHVVYASLVGMTAILDDASLQNCDVIPARKPSIDTS